jgi:hypothetical protein
MRPQKPRLLWIELLLLASCGEMRGRAALVLLAVATGLPACGTGERKAERTSVRRTTATAPARSPFPSDPALAARATTPRQRRELAQLDSDIRRLRAESAATQRKSLLGTPAVRAATARFIGHEQRSTLDNLAKNRTIDHAAAAVAPACEQCFQQLEAIRPIVDIAH